MKNVAVASFFLLLATSLAAQEKVADSTKHHSVRTATLLSAVVPGAGQVYNHLAMPKGKKNAFWKVPLIYAGLGTTGYFVLKNNQLQKELKNEYLNRQNDVAGLEKYALYDNQGVLTLYQFHQNQRDLFILGMALVYVLQVADAAVEAHFVSFDISEDLSLRFSPTVVGMANPGIKLSLKFVK